MKKAVAPKKKDDRKKQVSKISGKAKKFRFPIKKKAVVSDISDEAIDEGVHKARVRIIGVGGGAGNIVSEIAQRVPKIDFIVANTDLQALRTISGKAKTLAFGQEFTGGLGCGMDAELGEKAARAEKEKIQKIFDGQDVCILLSSLGGGTGSGAAPVFAQIANETKCLTLGIFTLPFQFEGEKRQSLAKAALEKLKPLVNAYIIIPNENIFSIIDRKTPLMEALSAVNKTLADSIEGLIETIYLPGLINIDFADLKALLEGKGRLAYLHSGYGAGPAKAQESVRRVLVNPLAGYGIEGTERILFNISSDRNVKMQEVAEISNAISSYNPKAKIIFGISHQGKFKETLRVTLFTVGCKEPGGKLEPLRLPETQKAVQPKATAAKADTAKKEEIKTSPVFPAKRAVAAKKSAAVKINIQKPKAQPPYLVEEQKLRRTGLDVKKAVDKELQDLEEKEKEWDVPAFLRNRSS